MCLFQHPLKSQCWGAVPTPPVHGGAVERGGVAGLAPFRRRSRTSLKIRRWDWRVRGDVSKPVVTQACSRRCVSFPAVSNRTPCANTTPIRIHVVCAAHALTCSRCGASNPTLPLHRRLRRSHSDHATLHQHGLSSLGDDVEGVIPIFLS